MITRYNDDIEVQVAKRHDINEEPNVTPYYILEYVQEQVYFSGQPQYFSTPRSSAAFAPGISRFSGYRIVRETLFIFGWGDFPRSRFEQVLRGPDGRLYAYVPGSPFPSHPDAPIPLDVLVNEGYQAYEGVQFSQ